MRAYTASPRRHARGFTLVELVAVLVILGIVAAVVAPRFVDTAVFSERGYADEIATSLRYARRIAVASGCNVRFTVNAAGYSAAQPTVRCVTAGAWGVAVQSPDRRGARQCDTCRRRGRRRPSSSFAPPATSWPRSHH
jgi:MSHA pilin protein MshC